MSSSTSIDSTAARTRARRVLEREVLARAQRALRHPADASPRSRGRRPAGRRRRRSARRGPTSRSSASWTVTESGGVAASSGPSNVSTRGHGRARAARQHDDLVARAAACRPRPGRRSGARAAAGVLRPDHPLHRQPQRPLAAVRRRRRPASRCSSSGGPSYQRAVAAARRRCRRAARRSGTRARPRRRAAPASAANSRLDLAEAPLVPVDEVHLVHRGDEVADAEQRRERGVAARLLDDPVAGVDQDHREVRGRGARDHVARVALVARACRR